MQWLTGKNRLSSWLKGHSCKTALTWRLLLPVWKAFTSTQTQMFASDTSKNLLQSCLVFHLILDLLLKTSFWANFYSSYYIISSYLVKHSIQRNMNRGGEKRVSTGQEKSHSFTKTTREMNKKQWANYLFRYLENRCKGLHVFGKSSFLDLEPSTMIQTSLISHLLVLMFEFGSICQCLAYPGQIHCEFSMVYKKMNVLIWLRVYNHDFGL